MKKSNLYIKRQIKNPVDLSFAMTCFTMALYDLFAVFCYNSHHLAEGVRWQRAQVATLSLIGATFVWFTVDYANPRVKKYRNFFAIYFILAAGITLTDNTGISFQTNTPAINPTLPLPGHILSKIGEKSTGNDLTSIFEDRRSFVVTYS